jgi:adenylate cyclase
MDTDWGSPMMLVSVYKSINDEPQMRRAARTAAERAERAIAQDPTNGSALAGGAAVLVLSGEVERAREWIQRALVLDPDNLNMRYNIACTLAITGDTDEAIDLLEPFFGNVTSATRIRHAEADPDLDPIRDDPRFKKMLAAAKQRLGLTAAAE